MPSGPAICSSADADVDGDGWGWENNASCLVLTETETETETETGPGTGSGIVPGDSRNTASVVSLNSQFGASISGVDTHYYRIELANPTAIVIETSYQGEGSAAVLLEDAQGNVERLYLPFYGQPEKVPSRCFAAGSYLVAVENFGDSRRADNYTLNFDGTQSQCGVVNRSFGVEAYVEALGRSGVVYSTEFDKITAYDLSGSVLWENSDHSVYNVYPDDVGNLIVFGPDGVALINSSGQTAWRNALYSDVNEVVVGDVALVFIDGQSLRSLNINDGTERWVYQGDDYFYELVITDNGSVVASTYSNVVVLNP